MAMKQNDSGIIEQGNGFQFRNFKVPNWHHRKIFRHNNNEFEFMVSQIAIRARKYHRVHAPCAFTGQGVAAVFNTDKQ